MVKFHCFIFTLWRKPSTTGRQQYHELKPDTEADVMKLMISWCQLMLTKPRDVF